MMPALEARPICCHNLLPGHLYPSGSNPSRWLTQAGTTWPASWMEAQIFRLSSTVVTPRQPCFSRPMDSLRDVMWDLPPLPMTWWAEQRPCLLGICGHWVPQVTWLVEEKHCAGMKSYRGYNFFFVLYWGNKKDNNKKYKKTTSWRVILFCIFD